MSKQCCTPMTSSPLSSSDATDAAAAFKALGDPVRLRLMSVIASAGGEICVCELTPLFDVSGPTVSHHLRVLRSAGLIECERRGTWVYYWPLPDRLRQISTLLSVPESAMAE